MKLSMILQQMKRLQSFRQFKSMTRTVSEATRHEIYANAQATALTLKLVWRVKA